MASYAKEKAKGVNVIPSTWAFKVKRYPDGRFRKFKDRFCVRGDFQRDGVDYTEPYSPVVSWSTVRTLLCLSMREGWKSRKIDFTKTFALTDLADNVYITQPPMYGHDSLSKKDLVLKLNISLYGLV